MDAKSNTSAMRRTTVLLMLVSSLAHATPPRVGQVIHIVDGDTLTLLSRGEKTTVHLAGIDAPEPDQPFGHKAKKCLGLLSLGKTASIIEMHRDGDADLLGNVYVGDRDINAALVEEGCAWVEPSRRRDTELLRLEAVARRKNLGLWANQGVIPPWEWRAGKRTISTKSGSVQGLVVGNGRDRVYHLPGCPGHGQVESKDRVLFATVQAAEADGYRRAPSCPER